MNATSLYVSTNRLVMQCNAEDRSSWIDLYRLVPYLRQSLSCTVCGELLMVPWTPGEAQCQHHVCRDCRGGRKKLKPTCDYCKDYGTYEENEDLRILLQCYKGMCEYLMVSDVFTWLEKDEDSATVVDGGLGLIDIIKEGAAFGDYYRSTAGLSKSEYSILPCVYSNSANAQASIGENSSSRSAGESPPTHEGTSKSLSNGASVYSVMYAGTGNKITIKRKNVDDVELTDKENTTSKQSSSNSKSSNQLSFKKPTYRSRSSANRSASKRKGCRCGNATATPGKLTCCGQRCPCYVESKACMECKCKGCRNPHRPDGMKIRPMHPGQQVEIVQSLLSQEGSPSLTGSMDSIEGDTLTMDDIDVKFEEFDVDVDIKPNKIDLYTTQLHEVTPSLPAAILMDEEENSSSCGDTDLPSGEDEDTGWVVSPRSQPSFDTPTEDVCSDIEVDI